MPDDTRPDAKNARAPLFRALKAIVAGDEKVTNAADKVDKERGLSEVNETVESNRQTAKDRTSRES